MYETKRTKAKEKKFKGRIIKEPENICRQTRKKKADVFKQKKILSSERCK